LGFDDFLPERDPDYEPAYQLLNNPYNPDILSM